MLTLKIVGLWLILSCTLGPYLWLFFYGERQLPTDSPSSKQAAWPS
jgi:hypothetical protein